MFTLEPSPTVSDVLSAGIGHRKIDRDANILYLGSGKAALRLVFAHLKQRDILEHKMAPIIVPPWLGTWVYATLLPYGFPVLAAEDAKVALVYHQYGFPQDMDKVRNFAKDRSIILVEDCAHACGGTFRDSPLGSFGEYAIFSFSKFVPCFALGGACGEHPDFDDYVKHEISQASTTLRLAINAFKYIDESNLHTNRPVFPRAMAGLRSMAYARYPDQVAPGPGATFLWLRKRDGELAARRDNYKQLRAHADRWGICDHLENSGVVPYGVPLNIPTSKTQPLIAELAHLGIAASSNRFDFARCVFEPDYRPTVLVPIHSQMAGQGMERLCDALDKVM